VDFKEAIRRGDSMSEKQLTNEEIKKDVINMEKKKGIMLVIAPDVMQKYFEGEEDERLDEVIEKCAEFPEQTRMSTATQALIFALQKAKTIDGARLKKFLDHAKIIDVERMRNAGIKKL